MSLCLYYLLRPIVFLSVLYPWLSCFFSYSAPSWWEHSQREQSLCCVVMEQSGVEQRWQEKVPTVPSYTIILSCQITHQPVGTAVHLLEPTTLLKSSQLLMAFFSTELLSGYSAVWSYHSKHQATEALILTFVYHFTLLWYMDHVIILTNFFLAFSFFAEDVISFGDVTIQCPWAGLVPSLKATNQILYRQTSLLQLEFTILNIKLPLKNTCNTCTRFLW